MELPKGESENIGGIAQYPNVSVNIGAVIAAGKATLHELDTVYGVEDLYDLLEIIAVEGHNRRVFDKWLRRKQK